jgi:hypothetical protein
MGWAPRRLVSLRICWRVERGISSNIPKSVAGRFRREWGYFALLSTVRDPHTGKLYHQWLWDRLVRNWDKSMK